MHRHVCRPEDSGRLPILFETWPLIVLNSPIRLDWLASEPQTHSCCRLPSAGIIRACCCMHHHAQHWVPGVGLRFLCLQGKCLPTEPSPQSWKTFKNWYSRAISLKTLQFVVSIVYLGYCKAFWNLRLFQILYVIQTSSASSKKFTISVSHTSPLPSLTSKARFLEAAVIKVSTMCRKQEWYCTIRFQRIYDIYGIYGTLQLP